MISEGWSVMSPGLICLVRRHQWHNGWDEDRHLTVWTCKRCGVTRRSDGTGARAGWAASGFGGGGGDGGFGGGDGGG